MLIHHLPLVNRNLSAVTRRWPTISRATKQLRGTLFADRLAARTRPHLKGRFLADCSAATSPPLAS